MSVWKRIGQIAEQNKQQEPAQEEQKQPEGEPKPEMELEETPGGVIY